MGARGLYVHVPFCAHRCGYCDFVTVTDRPDLHVRYVAALAREHELRGEKEEECAGGPYATVYLGGGTPTLLHPAALGDLLAWCTALAAPGAEVTIECNPETVTGELARALVNGGVTRVSVGAQSMREHVLATLERRATPTQVCAAIGELRTAGIPNISLDLMWGVPGQSAVDLAADLDEIVALAPDHVSAYELELKPGTRMTHRFGTVAEAVGDRSDDHYDLVVDALTGAGYDWYETANFARDGRASHHNLGYWTQVDHVGLGVGAVGTVAAAGGAAVRRANLPNLPRYLAAVEAGDLPPARIEQVDARTTRVERIMLGLRLARPMLLDPADLDDIVDRAALGRLAAGGLALVDPADGDGVTVTLSRRGRMLLNSVLTELLG